MKGGASSEPGIRSEVRHELRRAGKSLKIFCPSFPIFCGASIRTNRYIDHDSPKITVRFITADGARFWLSVFTLGANAFLDAWRTIDRSDLKTGGGGHL